MPGPDPPSRHGRRERLLLTLFFCLHFGAVLTYVAPSDPASLEGLPETLRAPVARVVPPLARRAWPVAAPYLNLTATRQHWFLFSPSPAQWASSLEVVAYFPTDAGDVGVAAPGSAESGDGRYGEERTAWRADTLRIHGPREAPLPHWRDHRFFRLVFNMGYEGWGEFYRPYYARALCRRLERVQGRRPGGIELFAVWERTEIPWRDVPPADLHRQDLGGYTCPETEAPPGTSAGLGAEGAPPGARP